MKKLLSAILALTLVFGLAACGGNSAEETQGADAQELPASALEILETVWADFAEEEKFPVIGGSMAAPVDNAPGSYDLADENISYQLLIPADQLGSVTEAASMIHMMNANTFTCAAYKLADGVTAAEFGAAMKDAVMNNQWMCGFPDSLLIRAFGDSYVVVAFGINDAMTPFDTHLTAAYPGMETIASESIA
nr:hypothetical protein [Oscillospiraceae bacterium]